MMATEKRRDTSVLKIAADMLEEAGWNDEAAALRRWAKAADRAVPQSIEILGRRWFQKSYGNTYHTVRALVNGEEVYASEKTYGYGDSYLDTAWDWLGENGYLGDSWRYPDGPRIAPWQWASENGVEFSYSAEDVKRERDL